MQLQDLFDLERGPAALVKYALYPLALIVICQVVIVLLDRLPAYGMLLALLFLIFTSPLAYVIRKARGHGHERGGSRRGAERTPLLPPNGGAE